MVKSNQEIEDIVKDPSTTDISNSSDSRNSLASEVHTQSAAVGPPPGVGNTSSPETPAAVEETEC